VVLVNQGLARRYTEELGLPPEKVTAAPNGVDLEAFDAAPPREEARRRLGLPLETPIIGYVGSFRAMGREKGVPELVRAMALLSASGGQAPLLVCVGGPREAVAAYRTMAREAGLAEERVRFVDQVPHVEVPWWLGAFDAAVIPLPEGEHYARLSPLKLFEYMAAGVPVVASDLPNIREVIRDGENGLLVAPGDPQALARGLARVLQDKAGAANMAAQARQDAAAYTWKERARRILERAEGA
jgi:glycosyltransferase involved in cell wall biosynthesis